MRVRYLVLAFVALAAALGVTSSPASAQTTPCTGVAGTQYPPAAPSLSVSQTSVAPGTVIQVTGRCCPPNSLVTLTFTPGNVPLGTAQADADGSYSASVAIPPGAAPGTGTITATAPGCSASTTVSVLGETITRNPTTGGTGLPRTGGASTIPSGIAGLGLVIVGLLTVAATRRKRAAAQ